MSAVRFLRDVARGTVICLLVVVGGMTLFLILAPFVGYVAYGDRPPPGFYGLPSHIRWGDVPALILDKLGYGLFFLIMTAPGALFCAIAIRALERIPSRPALVRVVGGVLGAIVMGFCMLSAAGSVNMALPAWLVSVALGALAGAWAMPRRRAERLPAPTAL
jgi:hypothetical protein